MPVLSLLILLLGFQTLDQAPAARTNASLIKEAREAHNRGENATFLALYEELARRRPGEIFTLYNLACGQALNGQTEATRDPRADPDSPGGVQSRSGQGLRNDSPHEGVPERA